MNMLSVLAIDKYFPKSMSQQDFDHDLFAKLLRIVVALDFFT